MKQKLTFAFLILLIASRSLISTKDVDAARRKTCKVHGEILKLDTVPITYGLRMPRLNYNEAREWLFPNSKMSVWGGCVLDMRSRPTAKVWYCQKCRDAEAEWDKENPGPVVLP